MRAHGRSLEAAAAFVVAGLWALFVQRDLLRADVVEGDAVVHQYWMRSFTDSALFGDPLTAELRRSERYPDAYEGLFWLASHVVDPISFGEWLGIALMAVAGGLVYLIVRDHTSWRPAPWIGMALFLALDTHRFHGGFPRGFLHVVVLLTVLLALRGRNLAAAVAAAGGVLFYPPAALLSVGVLLVARPTPLRTARSRALRDRRCCPTCSPAARRASSPPARPARSPSSGRPGRCTSSSTRPASTWPRTAAASTCAIRAPS